MIEFEYLLRLYDTWRAERDRMIVREDNGHPPRSSEWERSDDFGLCLLTDFVNKARETG